LACIWVKLTHYRLLILSRPLGRTRYVIGLQFVGQRKAGFVRYPSSTLEKLHKLTTRHRQMVERATLCGCFYCLRTFPPTAISDWVDEKNLAGATALCPHCGIDSVIPQQPNQPLNADVLAAMHAYWFDRSVSISSTPSIVQRLRLRLHPIVRRWKWDWADHSK